MGGRDKQTNKYDTLAGMFRVTVWKISGGDIWKYVVAGFLFRRGFSPPPPFPRGFGGWRWVLPVLPIEMATTAAALPFFVFFFAKSVVGFVLGILLCWTVCNVFFCFFFWVASSFKPRRHGGLFYFMQVEQQRV